jgi:3-deoxy-D-manno-octulosonate 8-phosphate phosphatase (KDO 8-P phosphatase)
MSEALPAERATRIKLIVLDVDGVLTDGGLLLGVTPAGESYEQKRFEITDGLGVKLLVWAGLHVCMVSGRPSRVNQLRADELGIPYHEARNGYKLVVVDALRDALGCAWLEVCCLADDLADLPILERAGLPVAVANAVSEIKQAALWHTTRPGGAGAVREFAEALLHARGEWDALLARYVGQRTGPAGDSAHTAREPE